MTGDFAYKRSMVKSLCGKVLEEPNDKNAAKAPSPERERALLQA
jgi:hypothetical protein